MKKLIYLIPIVMFFLYIQTAPPAVDFGDSGLIASASETLGIAHPPGYPLSILSGKIATMIFPGNAAFALNVFSALVSSLCFIFLFKVILLFIGLFYDTEQDNLAINSSLIISLIFSFSPLIWRTSITAKGSIYMMAILTALLSVIYLLRYAEKRSNRHMYLSAYIAGFLPVMHQSLSFVSALVIVSIIYLNFKNKDTFKWKFMVPLVMLSLFTPVLFILIRVQSEPEIKWQEIYNLKDMFEYLARKSYLKIDVGLITFRVFVVRFLEYIRSFTMTYSVAVIGLAVGTVVAFIRKKNLGFKFIYIAGYIYIIAFIFASVIGAGLRSNSISPQTMFAASGFYPLIDIFVLILSASGIYFVIKTIKIKYRKMLVVFYIVPVIMIFSGYTMNNNSDNYISYDHANNILSTMKSGDILLTDDDLDTFNMLYYRRIIGSAAEKSVYNTAGHLLPLPGYTEVEKREFDLTITNSDNSVEVKRVAGEQLKYKILNDFIQMNKGRIYFSFLPEYKNFERGRAGILYSNGTELGEAIFLKYTIRGYGRDNIDIYSKGILAEYFIRRAGYATITKDGRKFRNMIAGAERLSGNNTQILNEIGALYFYELNDARYLLKYLERAIELDRYDGETIRLMIRLCDKYKPEDVIKWKQYYMEKML